MLVAQDVRSAIEEQARQFSTLYACGNTQQVAALYTRDGQCMPAGMEAVTGRDAIEQFWRGAMDMGIKAAEIEVLDVESAGDLAFDSGRYVLKAQDGTVLDRGKYVVVWKRDGDTWRIHRDIWTTNIR